MKNVERFIEVDEHKTQGDRINSKHDGDSRDLFCHSYRESRVSLFLLFGRSSLRM